jgi:hypothetical protein
MSVPLDFYSSMVVQSYRQQRARGGGGADGALRRRKEVDESASPWRPQESVHPRRVPSCFLFVCHSLSLS